MIRMNRPSWFLGAALMIPIAAQGAVSIDDVVNAGSRIPTGLPSAGVAQGAVFAVLGKGLGPDSPVQASGFPLPTTDGLGGVTVQVSVGGSSVDAILVYASATQVVAILPSATATGTGTVTVNNNGDMGTSAITVIPTAFGLFTAAGTGTGQVLAFNVSAADGSTLANGLSQPVATGQNVILNGTGLGAITSDETQAGVMDVPSATPTVFIGGVQATVVSAGRGNCCGGINASYPVLPGIAGWDTITVTVPSGLQGCRVPVAVQIGNTVSNFGTISIAAADGTCYDSTSASAGQIQNVLNASGTFKTAGLSLSRFGIKLSLPGGISATSINDSASATFQQYDLAGLQVSADQLSVAQFGSCLVTQIRSSFSFSGPLPVGLDAGAVVNLSGPKGSKPLTKQSLGNYSAVLGSATSTNTGVPGLPPIVSGSSYLDAGNYTFDNGSGGADVGAFKVTQVMPATVNWDNQDSISNVVRSQGLTVKWSGGDPASQVQIQGIGSMTLSKQVSVSAIFVCTEKASVGTFTVPSYVLLTLPQSSVIGGTPSGLLSLYSATSQLITLPNVDYASFIALSGSAKNVNFQ